nr:ATP-dependent DNA helicase [Tumebacillus amylolyticus]
MSAFEQILPEHYQSSIVRQSQVQMAIDILDFLQPTNPKRILIVEAPVGTGKSLGALLPAMQFVQNSIKRVLYATSTINLQGQLMREEVPLLQKMGLIKKPLLAMGKSNYYCHVEFENNMEKLEGFEGKFSQYFTDADTGQRNDFENLFEPVPNAIWEQVLLKASRFECGRCRFWPTCPTRIHRQRFLNPSNDLVITNHDQLIRSTLNAMSEDTSEEIVPTTPGVIILDEAHDFQENHAGQLESVLHEYELGKIKRFLPKDCRSEMNQVEQELRQFMINERQRLVSKNGRYSIPERAKLLLEKMKPILHKALNNLVSNINQNDSRDPSDIVESILIKIDHLLDEKANISWVEYEDLSFTSITRKFPTEFRKLLMQLKVRNKLIIMSGTLTAEGDFTSMLERWRLGSHEVITRSFSSPFDFKKQARIYVPDNLVRHRGHVEIDPIYLGNQVQHIKKLIEATNGRTLILTTSKQHMDDVHQQLHEHTKQLNLTLLKQGQASVERLSKTFKEEEHSVLIGSGSFYSGLSVPGKSLISVILTKLPFPVPDDPYLSLIGEGMEDDLFNLVLYPNMMVKLTQAIGRLIRDIKDYGVVTILDPRVYENDQYGHLIRRAFESQGYQFTRSEQQVFRFFKRCDKNLPKVTYKQYKRSQLQISTRLSGKPEKRNVPRKVAVETHAAKKEVVKVTEQQWLFYERVCELKGKPLGRPKKLRSPRALYEALYAMFYTGNEDVKFVVEEFPYINEAQRAEFSTYNGAGLMRSYRMSEEELAQLQQRLSSKNKLA